MLTFIAAWRREREALRELSRLTDRELTDLGLRRSSLREVATAGRTGNERGASAPFGGINFRGSVAA